MTRRRSFLLWAALLAGPALVLALLGFRSVDQADHIRRHDAIDASGAAADAALAVAVGRLEEYRRQEQARPYYEYQSRYMPADVTGVGPAFVQSRLADLRDAPTAPSAWFRYVLAQGRVSGPDLLPEGGVGVVASPFTKAYDGLLRAKLLAASKADWSSASVDRVPLEVVAANEEVGQLLEEVGVAQSEGKQTAYLEGFSNRTQNRANLKAPVVTVGVRSTPVRFLSVPGFSRLDEEGVTPVLVAWKAVWVPGDDAKELRDAPVDRWYLVGCAFCWPVGRHRPNGTRDDPQGDRSAYAPDGTTRLLVGDGMRPVDTPERVGRRLADRLDVEGVDPLDARLGVVAIPDWSLVRRARQDDWARHLWTSTALLSIVAVGLYVLFRSVRRETDAAQRRQDFVAAVTHELKTPLAGIRMYADMLKEGWVPEGESSTTYAERIVGETKRLSGLVDQVLDFSAYERGVSSFQPVPGDFGVAVREAVALCAPAAAEAGVPVRVEVEPGLPPVAFDGTLVRSLVVNLVDNAIKYSARAPTKDVCVGVRRDGATVALSVADRGVGIPAADRARVFEPFFRSGEEMTRTARGVGIGLALVARYAKAHDAKIELESEVGRGTTVTVRFAAKSTA